METRHFLLSGMTFLSNISQAETKKNGGKIIRIVFVIMKLKLQTSMEDILKIIWTNNTRGVH